MQKVIYILAPKNLAIFIKNELVKVLPNEIIINPGYDELVESNDIQAVLDFTNIDLSENYYKFEHNVNWLELILNNLSKQNGSYHFFYNKYLTNNNLILLTKNFIKDYARNNSISVSLTEIGDIYGKNIINNKRLFDLFIQIINSQMINPDANYLYYLTKESDLVNKILNLLLSDINGIKEHRTFYDQVIKGFEIKETDLVKILLCLTDVKVDPSFTKDSSSKFIADTSYNHFISDIKELLVNLNIPLKNKTVPTNSTDSTQPQAVTRDSIRDNNPNLEVIDHSQSDSWRKVNMDLTKAEESEKIQNPTTAIIMQPQKPSITNTANEENIKLEDPYEKYTNSQKNYDMAEIYTEKGSSNGIFKKIFKGSIFLLFLLLTFSLGSIIYFTRITIGSILVSKSVEAMQKSDYQKSLDYSDKAKRYLGINSIPYLSFFIADKFFNSKDLDNLNSTLYYTSSSIYNFTESKLALIKNLSTLNNDTSNLNVLGFFSNETITLGIDKANEDILLAKSSQQKIKNDKLYNLLIKDNFELAENTKTEFSYYKNLLPVLNLLLGYKGEEKYLLLILDSNEIRPNGGKIKFYSTLEVQNGKFSIREFSDGVKVDKLMNEKDINSPPPFKIRNTLDKNKLYFTDSLFELDFNDSAKLILDLYKNIYNEDLKGVIAINTSSLGLFSSKGKDLNKIDNINELFKSTLSDVNKSDTDKNSLISLVFAQLLNKNILLFNRNEQINTAFYRNNWNGGINDTDNNYIYVTDSNLSGTLNNLIEKKVEYANDSNNQPKLKNILKVEYKYNIDKNDSKEYTDYIRILLPQKASITNATINKNGLTSYLSKAQETYWYKGKLAFATDMILKPKDTFVLSIEYDLPIEFNKKPIVDHQPGEKNSTYLINDN